MSMVSIGSTLVAISYTRGQNLPVKYEPVIIEAHIEYTETSPMQFLRRTEDTYNNVPVNTRKIQFTLRLLHYSDYIALTTFLFFTNNTIRSY